MSKNVLVVKFENHVLPFHSINKRVSKPFDIVWFDVWGLALVDSLSGSRYYILFIGFYSRYIWIYLQKLKYPEFLETFMLWFQQNFHAKSIVMVGANTLQVCSLIIYVNMRLLWMFLVHILHNKMAFLCININILSRVEGSWYMEVRFPLVFGWKLFIQLPMLLIDCPWQLWTKISIFSYVIKIHIIMI